MPHHPLPSVHQTSSLTTPPPIGTSTPSHICCAPYTPTPHPHPKPSFHLRFSSTSPSFQASPSPSSSCFRCLLHALSVCAPSSIRSGALRVQGTRRDFPFFLSFIVVRSFFRYRVGLRLGDGVRFHFGTIASTSFRSLLPPPLCPSLSLSPPSLCSTSLVCSPPRYRLHRCRCIGRRAPSIRALLLSIINTAATPTAPGTTVTNHC